MPQPNTQVKVFISCPSDVESEKEIATKVCDGLSDRIFARKGISIRVIDWQKDVPHQITGEEPQKVIDKALEEEDYDIYIGILWKRFGKPKADGLTPTEGEFQDALNRQKKTGRPIIKFLFKEEQVYPENTYEAEQLLAVQKFKEKLQGLGLYDNFKTDLEFQKNIFLDIHDFVYQLSITEDSQILFKRIEYPSVIDYIPRKVCKADTYKTDEFWFLGDKDKEDVTRLVKLKNRIALVGDAGSGKTLELERVANHFSQENSPFYPLLIPLNTYTDQSISELLPENWKNIPENQLLIILDGLDEIESKNKRHAIRKIESFSERYPSSVLLVSCRTNFYQTESEQAPGTLGGFEAYRVLDLEFNQIESYVNSKLLSRSSRFYKEINKNYLVPLLRIPFYLVNLVEIFWEENSLPKKRSTIFDKLLVARMKLDEQHFRTTLDLEGERDAIFRNLKRVALGMECLGRNYLLDNEYTQLVPSSSSRDLLKHCTAWRKVSGDGIQWQFEHNSIQEYLAASALSCQPLSVIKDFVSFKPEYRKVIPSWANTVSFLLSISDEPDLLNWILRIEPEICMKIEADRIQEATRIEIFKDIFNRYKEKKIRIGTDRFKIGELARFGQSDEVLEFLLNEAEKASHLSILANTIEIMSEMDIPPDYKGRTRDLLEKVATNKFSIQVADSIQCTGLIALSHLKFDSKDVVDRVVSQLRDSKTDWIRYGLYYFLHESEFLDDFIEVFLEGIDLVSVDFSSHGLSRLANERWELKQGLKKANSPLAVRKIINHFIGKEKNLHDLFTGDYEISFIAEAATKAYSVDSSFLDLAVNFSFFTLEHHHTKETGEFLEFYEKTDTKFEAFQVGMRRESQYREEFIADLANSKCIEYILEQFEQGNVSDDFVWKFLKALRWKKNEIFDCFYLAINQKSNDRFVLKPVVDWEKIREEREERDIHLIFDEESLVSEIDLVFQTERKEMLTFEELSKLRSRSWPDNYYSDLAYRVLRNLARESKPVTMEIVKNDFRERDWNWFRITSIYDRLQSHEDLELAYEQKDWIIQWCYAQLDKVDFKTAIQKTDKKAISIRWDAIFVWYFFRRFKLQYPKNILLDMLSFDHDRNGIEYLEEHLEGHEITSRILENLSKGILVDDVLKNHIDYCRRHRVKEVIKYALIEIKNQDREPSDEIRRVSLEVISELSDDLSKLEQILPEIEDDFKWQVIDILIKNNSQPVLSFLKRLFKDEDEKERLKASEYLIKCQDLDALRFYVDWMKERKQISRQSFQFSSLRSLKISGAIPILMELLELSYAESFQQSDPFDGLDRLVLDSLTVIAFESDDNYLEVRKSVEAFIEKYSPVYQNVNWLNVFLDQLEQKYYINKSERFGIDEAVQKLAKIHL